MTIPSRVLGAGTSSLATQSICGTGAVGLVALGTTIADALLLSADYNTLTTSSYFYYSYYNASTSCSGQATFYYNVGLDTCYLNSSTTSGSFSPILSFDVV